MPTSADAALNKFSSTSVPGRTSTLCPPNTKKVISLQWEKQETWCSEGAPISGTTQNYADGEAIDIHVVNHPFGEEFTTLKAQVSGNIFRNAWPVLEVLPIGGPTWYLRRNLDGKVDDVKTRQALSVRFVDNFAGPTRNWPISYDRTAPTTGTVGKVNVNATFDLLVSNYLLTFSGNMRWVRARGGERVFLDDPKLSAGGFAVGTDTWHFGYADATGKFQYWNGTAFVPVPAKWRNDQDNHFGICFYKKDGKWICRDDNTLTWPTPWTDWADSDYKTPGNNTDKKLANWKKNIEERWTDKFDIKRQECKSTTPECCRYKTRCLASFTATEDLTAFDIFVVQEDIRSDAGLWSMGDDREGLAPHEFGHHLGAPDEYPKVATTQLGVNDDDGLKDGIDDDCLMGVKLSEPKRRHYKGICLALAGLVKQVFGKTYTYKAVAKDKNLASPPDTLVESDPGPPPPDPVPADPPAGPGLGTIVGAVVGAIVGAAAGAVVGFVASGGNPWVAAVAGTAGAAAGAAIGDRIGSLFD